MRTPSLEDEHCGKRQGAQHCACLHRTGRLQHGAESRRHAHHPQLAPQGGAGMLPHIQVFTSILPRSGSYSMLKPCCFMPSSQRWKCGAGPLVPLMPAAPPCADVERLLASSGWVVRSLRLS